MRDEEYLLDERKRIVMREEDLVNERKRIVMREEELFERKKQYELEQESAKALSEYIYKFAEIKTLYISGKINFDQFGDIVKLNVMALLELCRNNSLLASRWRESQIMDDVKNFVNQEDAKVNGNKENHSEDKKASI